MLRLGNLPVNKKTKVFKHFQQKISTRLLRFIKCSGNFFVVKPPKCLKKLIMRCLSIVSPGLIPQGKKLTKCSIFWFLLKQVMMGCHKLIWAVMANLTPSFQYLALLLSATSKATSKTFTSSATGRISTKVSIATPSTMLFTTTNTTAQSASMAESSTVTSKNTAESDIVVSDPAMSSNVSISANSRKLISPHGFSHQLLLNSFSNAEFFDLWHDLIF